MRVGVIGAGAISDIYLENMINKFDQLEVKCVAANHIESAQKKAEKYGIKACTTQEMLDDPEIDLAVVLTPVGAHYGLIKQALLAGKHVYTEKTIADDVDKAKELVALAKEKGLYAAPLASIRQMSGQVSRGSVAEYQADERAGVARLCWRVSV